MLCASAAPDAPGLIINATRYMNIHDRKPGQPSQPGIIHRGERVSRVGGVTLQYRYLPTVPVGRNYYEPVSW